MKKFRFSDYLNWSAVIAPGVVSGKDGSLIAGWRMYGLDLESAPEELIEAEFARLGAGFAGFDDADAFWVTLSREPFNPVEGVDISDANEVVKVIELDRQDSLSQVGQIYRNVLTLCYQYKPRSTDLTSAEVLDAFETKCRSVESRLGSSLRLERLSKEIADVDDLRVGFDGLAGHLATLMSGQHRRIRKPKHLTHIYLDQSLGIDWVQPSITVLPKVDERYLAVISVEGFPAEFPRGALHALEEVGISFTWTSRFVAQSRQTTRTRASWFRRQWKQSAADMVSSVATQNAGNRDSFADQMALDVDAAVYDSGSGAVGYGSFVTTINIWSEPDVDERAVMRVAEDVARVLLDAGFEARLERENALEAFIGSLPGHRHRNPRDVMITTSTFVDMLPLRTIWRGEPVNPCNQFPKGSPPLLIGRARTGEEFYFNLHNGDVGHTLMFGPTGGGKSVLLGLITAEWLKYRGRVIYFDKGRSIQYLTHAVGGSFMAFGGAKATGINPLRQARILGEEWTTEWLKKALRAKAVEFTPGIHKEVEQAVKVLMASNVDLTFERIADYIQNAPAVRDTFNQYQTDPHLNSPNDHLDWSDFTTFETEELFKDISSGEKVDLILDYLFAMVDRQLDGRPTLIVIDEAASFYQHASFAPRIQAWLKEQRKRNASVLMATQTLKDVIGSSLASDLLEQCHTKIFLPNAAVKAEQSYKDYEAVGCSSRQIDLISGLMPKRDYYIVQRSGERVVDFMIRPMTLSLVGRTAMGEGARAQRLAEDNPDFWRNDLLHALEAQTILSDEEEGTS